MTELGELTEAILADVCSLVTDGTHDTPRRVKLGYPLIKAKEIVGGRIDFEICDQISEEEHLKVVARSKPEFGDTLFAHIGASLGEAAFVNTTREFSIKNIALFKPNPAIIDPRYLHYLVISPAFQSHAKGTKTGSAQPFLGLSQLRSHRIQYHRDMAIQCRIAGILSAYDELIENNQRRIKILEEMARSLYCEWFVHFRFPGHNKVKMVPSPLGPIPQGWEVRPVPGCVSINPRVAVPREDEKPFVPMGSLVNDSMLITSVEARVGNSGAKFQNGDTLFARITPCLENGKTGFVQFLPDSKAVAFGSTEFIVLRSCTLTPEFVYLLARSEEFRGNAIKSMSGASGRQRVKEQCFDRFLIAQPARPLLDHFSAIVAPSFRLIQKLHLQTENLRRTRDLLLPRLLSGSVNLTSVSPIGAHQ